VKHDRAILCRISLAEIVVFSVLLVLPAGVCTQAKSACTLPDCDQAKDFFAKVQKAIDADQRQDVAAMVSYPLRSYRDGKLTAVKTKAELLARYDSIFDPGTRCAIKAATVEDVWGNWHGFTVSAGVIWWDRIIPDSVAQKGTIQPSDLSKYPFGVISVNHSPETAKSCAGNANASPK